MSDSIQIPGETLSNEYRSRLDAVVGRGQSTYTPTQIVVEQVRGSRLWTMDGRELIDFTSGVLVSNLGYSHPRFEELYETYVAGLPRNGYNMVTSVLVEASERLVASMGIPKLAKCMWAASGSEGIQKAMWMALHLHPERSILVATRGGFHGKKGLAGDVSGEKSPNPNVRFISFPMGDDKPQSFYQEELDALAAEFPGKIALLITEPYLGARGSYHPPKWYHKMLQAWCEKHDIPFIFDEVQSCFGRTGEMYAFETYGVQPDLVVLGKGLASGVPAAAVVGRADLVDSLNFGEGSDTFSATPAACAAVCATLQVFQEERIVDHCKAIAEKIRAGFESLQQEFSFIREVRGEGLVYGIEITDAATANRCVVEAYLGVNGKGVHFLGPLAEKVLRVSPPLVITEEEVDEAFRLLRAAWARVSAPAAVG